MKKIVFTGFEPFGGESINPSWEAVSLLPLEIGEYSINKLLIPVVFGEAAQIVIDKAENTAYDVIICVGQAGGRNAITPELVGINLRYASIPDNKGNQPRDELIKGNGETAFFSTLPVRKITEAINTCQIPSQVSYSAGTYVCNDLFYTLLSHFNGTKTRVGFIHIPYCKEQNKEPSIDINDIVKGLIVVVENMD